MQIMILLAQAAVTTLGSPHGGMENAGAGVSGVEGEQHIRMLPTGLEVVLNTSIMDLSGLNKQLNH
jgi:hypothetical protein